MSTAVAYSLGAAYLRRSTDHQDRSIEDQRAAVERFAQRHSIDLVAYYTDDAISGTTRHRSSFQQMIADACCEPRPFDFVIVYDVSRFGRMDNDETGYYRHILRMHGVRVCYTTEGFVEASIDDLIRPVKQWHAREESKGISRITIRGHVSKFHSKGGGWWISGVSPFGYDRRYQDAQGQFLCVVRNMPDRTKQLLDEHGKVLRILLPRETLYFSDRDRSTLVLSEPTRVLLVRRIFYECALQGIGCTTIAHRLNHEGVPPPRNADWGRKGCRSEWQYCTIRGMVSNPAYVGDIVWNRRTKGMFHCIADGMATERPRHEAAVCRGNDAKHWLTYLDAHEPIVSRQIFELAQQVIEVRRAHSGRFSPDVHRQESDFRAWFVLTGLLECAACGNAYWGMGRARKYLQRRRSAYCARVYGCLTRKVAPKGRVGCRLGTIRQRVLERIVTERLVAWYRRYLASKGPRRIQELAVQRCRGITHATSVSASEESILAAAEQIEKSALAFLGDLRGQLRHADVHIRRLAFRRCVDHIVVDVPNRRLWIWVRRLPIPGTSAGGLVRIMARLPKLRRHFVVGDRKRLEHRRYSLAWHLARKPARMRVLLTKIREMAHGLGPEVIEAYRHSYVSFSVNRHFMCARLNQTRALIYLRLDPKSVTNPPRFFRDVTGLGTRASGNVELSVRSSRELLRCRPLIELAYQRALVG